ncbi:hypothetical protein CHISP_0322 [Chitinispirillum alkaliphilum]|nr:hypothetical protein CHISP_0322 [Chitinispirillum alkaliphilum]
MEQEKKVPGRVADHVHKEIIDAISGITYGEVVVTIHDSKIVQIEKKEKKRFK